MLQPFKKVMACATNEILDLFRLVVCQMSTVQMRQGVPPVTMLVILLTVPPLSMPSILNVTTAVQNAAARLLSNPRRRDHITPVLSSLHWLPVISELYNERYFRPL